MTGLDKWLPIRPAHKDDEISGEVLVALRLEKVFTATDPTTEKVINSLYYAYLVNFITRTCSILLNLSSFFISLIVIRSLSDSDLPCHFSNYFRKFLQCIM